MAWLHDGEKISKISLFVLALLTNVTDGRTDGHCMPACGWRFGLVVTLALINVVALCQTRLVLGWVTVCGRVNHLGM